MLRRIGDARARTVALDYALDPSSPARLPAAEFRTFGSGRMEAGKNPLHT
jgi:hypothetical protein